MIPSKKILEVPITIIDKKKGVELFINFAQKDSGTFFAATPNAEILLESLKNLKLKSFLQKTQLNFCDSVSLRWAAEYKFKNWSKLRAFFELLCLPWRQKKWQEIPETICGSDIFEDICKQASQKNLSIFLLGGQNGVAEKTKKKLIKKFPKIKISGTDESFLRSDKDTKELLIKINKTAPKIIFLAYGCPKQELWLAENLAKISTARIGIGVGGSFDFYSGNTKRAPKCFQQLGLEWLWRLIIQPQRVGRIFRAVFVFPWMILFQEK